MRIATPVLLCTILLVAVPGTPAQVVVQLTDEKTTVAGPGVLDDAGTVLFAGASADFAGENPDHTFQIVRFDPVTGSATPVTSFSDGVSPLLSISDDGQWIAFPSNSDLTGGNHDESIELFVMDSTGGSITQITDDPAVNGGSVGAMAISGDGQRVVFAANTDPLGTNPDNLDQVFIVDRNGTGLEQLTASTGGGFAAVAISDDASRIVFAHDGDPLGSNTDLEGEVFAMNGDGTGLEQLTVSPAGFPSGAPALAGNGSRVAFQSSADLTGGNAVNQTEVFVIDWGGANLRQLTSTSAVLGILGDPTSQAPSITDDGLSIFYHSNQSSLFPFVNVDGNFEIFRIQADGTGRTQLTSTILDGGSVLVTVSGDGTRFTCYGIGLDISLRVENVAGTEEHDLLVFDPIFSDQPAVAPDGSRAVFVRTDGLFGGGQIWTANREDGLTAQVTSLASGGPSGPALAGDNSTILFSADSDPTGGNADGSEEIFSIQLDGSGILQLTGGGADTSCAHPDPATGAGFLVFDCNADLTGANADLSREIFRIGLDGTGLQQLTGGPVDSTSRLPRVDAAGNWIVFESDTDGNYEIYRMRSDGSMLQQLTADPLESSRNPDISGDGSRIAFSSTADLLGANPEGNAEIYLYRDDTASLVQLTDFADGGSGSPALTEDGAWVYFASNAPVLEDDPDRPSDLYRIPVAGGPVERVGALRRGISLSLFGSGSSAMALDSDGAVGAFSGIGDFTTGNPDGLPEIWLMDRGRPSILEVGRGDPTVLSWDPESGPVRYDVIRGDVGLLAAGGTGEIDLGPVQCIEDDSPDADTVGYGDEIQPASGQVLFYVYRGSHGHDAGPGSYGTSGDGRERRASAGDCAE